LATGLTEAHVWAIAEAIRDRLEEDDGVRPWHVEGQAGHRWILLDYVDWVVHVFHREAREFYQLERLWADAPREILGP
jgi:ribosome-associated protein